jgi:hypothetical protein
MKINRLIIVFTMFFSTCILCFAETMTLPNQSTEFSYQSASQALELCSKHFADKTKVVFSKYGLGIVIQKYYDKTKDDVAHTSAFTLGKGKSRINGVMKETFVLVVRGTNASEWYSNFDFAPSHKNDTCFSENFLFSAQDIFLTAYDLIEKQKTIDHPIVLICGHSRGAACANILGVLFDAVMNKENVYVYTFATPNTMKGESYNADNIFNIINTNDLVTKIPLASWGYCRAGKDIVLGEDEYVKELGDAIGLLYSLSPTIESYYNDRHSMTGAGLSPNGMTAYEVMELISERLALITATHVDIDVGGLEQFAALSSESDFSPLISSLQALMVNDGRKAKKVLDEHMPETYMKLLAEMEGQ